MDVEQKAKELMEICKCILKEMVIDCKFTNMHHCLRCHRESMIGHPIQHEPGCPVRMVEIFLTRMKNEDEKL